jgi:exopolysaccharide biosynthesis protein
MAAVGGYPVVIRAGMVAKDLTGADRPTTTEQRHPRTAVGFGSAGRSLWLLVVDGRREGHSEGMSLLELADFFLALGADEALNLDGGGSSTMVLGGAMVNLPSAPEGERPVANALAVVHGPQGCAPPEPNGS